MSNRVEQLINRRPSKWGNVSVKTFEQDIKLLTNTVKQQQEVLEEIKQVCMDYQNGHVGEMTDSFFVDLILDTIDKEKRKNEINKEDK